MTETFFVKPANPGATIIDPASIERLAPTGAEKPRDPYWLSLIQRGDVVEIEPPPAAEQPKPKSAKD